MSAIFESVSPAATVCSVKPVYGSTSARPKTIGITRLLISEPSLAENSKTSSVPRGRLGTPGTSMRKKKLPQIPVPPAWKCFCAISSPAALRSRAWSVPSKPVPTPATSTGSSTMSWGFGCRTQICGMAMDGRYRSSAMAAAAFAAPSDSTAR